MEFRPLQRGDDRTRFSCGNANLDTFFRRFAGQNQFRHQIGVTYILVDGSRIAGYVTVAAHSLQLPPDQRRGLPDYPLPVLLIARLAVDQSSAGRGVGKRLLRECCGLAVGMADQFGCYGLATDAKEEAIGFYQRFGFVALAELNERNTQLHFLGLKRFAAEVRRGRGGV